MTDEQTVAKASDDRDDADASEAKDARDDDADASEAKDAADDAPAEDAPRPADEEDTDAIFETLWDRTEKAWDDDKTHAALLEYALRVEMLPQLAGRYRAVQDKDDDRAPKAKKKIDGIVIALTNVMMAHKSPPPQKVPWQLTVSVGIACALAVLYLARLLLFVR